MTSLCHQQRVVVGDTLVQIITAVKDACDNFYHIGCSPPVVGSVEGSAVGAVVVEGMSCWVVVNAVVVHSPVSGIDEDCAISAIAGY